MPTPRTVHQATGSNYTLLRRHRQRARQQGMTLIELMVVVSITGVLATLGMSSYRQQVAQSQSVEAVATLSAMKQSVQVGASHGNSDGSVNFAVTTFGAPKAKNDKGGDKGGIDGDGNNGHGNNEDGCDPDNKNADKKGCAGGDTSGGDDASGDGKNDTSGDGSNNDTSGDGSNNDTSGDGSNNDTSGDGSNNDTSGDGSNNDTSGDGNNGNNDGGIDGDGNSGHGNNEDGCDPDNPGAGGQCAPEPGGSVGGDKLCGSASPVPSSIASVSGKSFRAGAADWATGDDENGWRCLSMSRSGPQRYQYGYEVGAPSTAAGEEGYSAWARGDLDGDGRTSLFRLRGDMINGNVVHAGALEVVDGNE